MFALRIDKKIRFRIRELKIPRNFCFRIRRKSGPASAICGLLLRCNVRFRLMQQVSSFFPFPFSQFSIILAFALLRTIFVLR